MKKQDLASVLEQLEQGVSPLKLEHQFAEDVDALDLIEAWCMQASLSQTMAPRKAGLKHVINQAKLLETQDESDWGMFSGSTRFWHWLAPSLMCALVLGVGINELAKTPTALNLSGIDSTVGVETNGVNSPSSDNVQVAKIQLKSMSVSMEVPGSSSSLADDKVEASVIPESVSSVSEVGSIESMAADWEASFESEIAEFYEMDAEFKDFKSQSIFSLIIKKFI